MSDTIEKLAIVIVTYKRRELLDSLLESLLFLENAPWRVIVIDNEDSAATAETVEVYKRLVGEGLTEVPWPEGSDTLQYVGMPENTGGAGGFSEGVKRAYAQGAEWFWLMDDDVVVMPRAIASLAKWTDDFDAVQGARLDYDGGPFYWQYRFIEPLGMYDPLAPSASTDDGWKPANAFCFEGALFSRRIVETLGPPDPRFFIYWDDCVYGYLASKVGRVAVVEDVILQRSRDVDHWEVTGVRQLNSASDMTRYHIMRNRGHMANYMKVTGDYVAPAFALGTAMVAAKELIRLAVVDRENMWSGIQSLYRGWVDGGRILHDAAWRPMTPDDLSEEER